MMNFSCFIVNDVNVSIGILSSLLIVLLYSNVNGNDDDNGNYDSNTSINAKVLVCIMKYI